jgi:hypothetical protein
MKQSCTQSVLFPLMEPICAQSFATYVTKILFNVKLKLLFQFKSAKILPATMFSLTEVVWK